ncbi:YjgP/YjgQ family permease [Deinococcus cavernae]|uniref:YjgP/YjgQ family permease n=2 Tax=Deinococcaceae TaxID=183710 RepID=A0A418VCB7_9DEIO|nr:YjgP/YjgQ family permease [Deinococcus cavernae]
MREVLQMYAVGLALFMVLQMTDIIASSVGRALQTQASFGQFLTALLAYSPTLLSKTLVVAVPFSILLALSRLQKDSEVKAIAAAGVRPLNLIWPLMLPFALVGLLVFWNAGTLMPAGLEKWEATWRTIYGNGQPIPSQDRYTYAPQGGLYYAGRVESDTQGRSARLFGVMVQRGNETLTAQTGTWDAQTRTWQLDMPWRTVPGEHPQQLMTGVTVPQDDTLKRPPPDPKKTSNAQLRAELAGGDLQGETRRVYQYTLASRYADSFTPLAFALAAGALGLLFRSRVAALGGLIVFVALFYVLWFYLMPQLARVGAVQPALAAWTPSLLFLLIGGVLAWRLK